MLKKSVALGLCLGFIATAALAQAQPNRGGTADEQKACSRDVTRFCKAMINADDLTILGCLQANRPKISAACNKVLQSHGV